METLRLYTIVMKLAPDWLSFLKQAELESRIVLRDGFEVLDEEGAMEIVRLSICEHQKSALIH